MVNLVKTQTAECCESGSTDLLWFHTQASGGNSADELWDHRGPITVCMHQCMIIWMVIMFLLPLALRAKLQPWRCNLLFLGVVQPQPDLWCKKCFLGVCERCQSGPFDVVLQFWESFWCGKKTGLKRLNRIFPKKRVEPPQPELYEQKTGLTWLNRPDSTRFWQKLCCQDIRIDWKGGRWGSSHPRLIIWGLLTRGNPGIVTIPQYRVNKTKQHTYTCRKPNQPTPILFNVSAYFRKKKILGPKFEIPSKKIPADI